MFLVLHDWIRPRELVRKKLLPMSDFLLVYFPPAQHAPVQQEGCPNLFICDCFSACITTVDFLLGSSAEGYGSTDLRLDILHLQSKRKFTDNCVNLCTKNKIFLQLIKANFVLKGYCFHHLVVIKPRFLKNISLRIKMQVKFIGFVWERNFKHKNCKYNLTHIFSKRCFL
jgi:hypothetical protein